MTALEDCCQRCPQCGLSWCTSESGGCPCGWRDDGPMWCAEWQVGYVTYWKWFTTEAKALWWLEGAMRAAGTTNGTVFEVGDEGER